MPDSEWTEVGGVINLKEHINESFIGEYVGSDEREGEFGPDFTHRFVGEDGVPFAMYGLSTLNRSIKTVPIGSRCRVTFLGKFKTKDGKKDYNAVRVEVRKQTAATAFSPDFPAPSFDPDKAIPF